MYIDTQRLLNLRAMASLFQGHFLKIKSIALISNEHDCGNNSSQMQLCGKRIELNPPQGGSDCVELYNSGNQTVNISGWTVTITDGSWLGKMPVPKGSIIPCYH
jgi:hypothetical protein